MKASIGCLLLVACVISHGCVSIPRPGWNTSILVDDDAFFIGGQVFFRDELPDWAREYIAHNRGTEYEVLYRIPDRNDGTLGDLLVRSYPRFPCGTGKSKCIHNVISNADMDLIDWFINGGKLMILKMRFRLLNYEANQISVLSELNDYDYVSFDEEMWWKESRVLFSGDEFLLLKYFDRYEVRERLLFLVSSLVTEKCLTRFGDELFIRNADLVLKAMIANRKDSAFPVQAFAEGRVEGAKELTVSLPFRAGRMRCFPVDERE